jgi:hypothetical protein
MEPGEIYELAGVGAAFMMGSQMEGGVFGWMHKPPDICLLSSQAQSVEWHCGRCGGGRSEGRAGRDPRRKRGRDGRVSASDKLREGQMQTNRSRGFTESSGSSTTKAALPDGGRALRRKRG